MQNIRYIDIHSHLNFPQFDDDREEIISTMKNDGVATITVGTGLATSKEAVALADDHEHLFATIGIHPTDDEKFDATAFEELLDEKVVAVGECGLDYFRIDEGDTAGKKRQEELFVAQIAFALEHDLPLMLHGRPQKGTMDAYEEMIDIISNFKSQAPNLKGNVHFFVGTIDVAKRFLERGFTLSFDGPVTFDASFREVVEYVPLDSIHAETDAPFAAPEPHRGKRNSPLYVSHIADALAEMRGVEKEVFRKQLIENAKKSFSLEL